MKTLEEKIAVMQAAAEGKEIEMETVYGWRYNSNPKWDWVKFDYRVKPEPEPKRYRPYTFEEAKGLIGKTVMSKDGSLFGSIGGVEFYRDNGLVELLIVDNWASTAIFLEDYTYLDGTPCGAEEGGEG